MASHLEPEMRHANHKEPTAKVTAVSRGEKVNKVSMWIPASKF